MCQVCRSFFIVLFTLFPYHDWAQKSNASTDIHSNVLDEYMNNANKRLIVLIQVYNSEITEVDNSNLDKYKITESYCKAYVSINPIQELSISIDKNNTYSKVDEAGEFVQLKNSDIEFWAFKSCVKRLNSNILSSLFSSVTKNDDFKRKLAKSAYNNYLKLKDDFESYLKENKTALFTNGKINQKYKEQFDYISEKNYYSQQIYEQIQEEYDNVIKTLNPINKLRIGGHALFGESNFITQKSSEQSAGTSNRNVDLLVKANYLIDEVSSAGLFISNKSKTLLTPFSEWRYGGSYNREVMDHIVSVKAEGSNFRDKGSPTLNYNRTNLNLNIRSNNQNDFQYRFVIRRLDQSYTERESSSFSSMNLSGSASYELNYDNKIEGSMRYYSSDSELKFLNYKSLKPSLTFLSRNSRTKLIVEQRNYSLDENLNNNRYHLNYRNRTGKKTNIIDATYRTYNNPARFDYAELGAIEEKRGEGNFRNLSLFEFRARVLPDSLNLSYADFRIKNRQGQKLGFFFDQNLRVFYPNSLSQEFNVDGIFGIEYDLKYLSIGPVFKWHLSIDPKADKVFDPLFNSYQLGFSISSHFTLMDKLNVDFRYIHDVSLIHYKQRDSSTESGFNVKSRNPINYQAYINLNYKINKTFSLIFSYQRFDHQANYDLSDVQTYLSSNQKNDLQLGIRVNPL